MDKKLIISAFTPQRDNLLNILHALQNSNPQNYLTIDDLKIVAQYLNISLSSVFGVARYYSMFSLKPRGKYVIRICKSPVCNMIGNKEIFHEIENSLGTKLGETSADQLFSVEETECLGRCAKAPAMMINDKTYTALDKNKVKELIHNIRFNEQNTRKP
jgi:NADH-quinone oxidoreductase subunit E